MLYHPRISTPQQAGVYYARKRNRAAQNAALVDDNGAPAWGTILFAESPIPSAGQTITIAGTILTLGSPISLTDPDTNHPYLTLGQVLAAVVSYVEANPISGASVSVSGNSLLVQSTKPADSSITIAASDGTASHSTLQKQKIRVRVPL